MHIGISTASFYPVKIEYGVAYAADLGFRSVELFLNSESEFGLPFRTMLKQRLMELDLQVISVHPFTSAMEGHLLFSDYTRRTHDALDQYERYFEAAADLGASYFTFHGQQLRARGLPPSQTEERQFDTYRKLCARASVCGITFTQENVSWCKSSDPEFLRSLYEHVPELRYTFDIKQAHRAGREWNDYVDAVGDRIVNLHISDYDKQSNCLLPGTGSVDFGAMFARLQQLGYRGNAIVEVYSSDYTMVEQLRQSRIFLESLTQSPTLALRHHESAGKYDIQKRL